MLVKIIVALVIVGLWTGWSSAQEPPPPAAGPGNPSPGSMPGSMPGRLPDSLDGMLAIALRTNPEVLQAEAKLNRAQADLNQARLKVIREVITAFHERKKLEETTDVQASQLERMQKMVETGQAPTDSAGQARLQLTEARARLAQVEAQIRYMMGNDAGGSLGSGKSPPRLPGSGAPAGPGPGSAASGPRPESEPRPRPPVPERLEQALNQRVSLNIPEGNGVLQPVCEQIRKALGGQTLVIHASITNQGEIPVQTPIELKDVPLKDALLAVADLFRVSFVLRDYGLLMVAPEEAMAYPSTTIPEQQRLEAMPR
jgi:outer membrane efflux protein